MDTETTPSWIEFIDLTRLPLAIGVVAAGMVAANLLTRFVDEAGERFGSRRLAFKKVTVVARFLIYFTVFSVALFNLIAKSEALVALGGAFGLALGFGMKDVLTSVTGGVTLLADAPFQVGDRISFGGYYGEVKRIGLRSVQLVTLDDNLVTVPNSQFLSDPVASANSGALDCMVVIPFYIGAAEDFETARRLVTEATVTSRYVYLEKPVVTLVSDEFLGERFVTVIRVKAYVFDVRYEKAFASDVTERVKRALRSAGIRTPDQQYRDLELNRRESPPPQTPDPAVSESSGNIRV